MELKCSICGKEFLGFGNNARPIKEGICCDSCNNCFVIPGRMFLMDLGNCNFEVVKTSRGLKEISQKLEEKNFEKIKEIPYNKLYQNPETEEKVIICIV